MRAGRGHSSPILSALGMRPGPCGKTYMYGMVLAYLHGSLILVPCASERQGFRSTEMLDLRYAINIPDCRYRGRCACLTPDTAVTPCTLYRLHRDDLQVAMVTQPASRKALEEESRKRMAMHYAG